MAGDEPGARATAESERESDQHGDTDESPRTAIRLDGVSVDFEGVRALADVDLRVEDGEFVTVIGPSGCGKTTTLRVVGGLQSPTAGTVSVGGHPPDRAREAGEFGFVFQRHALLPWKSALENVVFLRKLAGKPPDRERARDLLETVGLAGFADARPAELSGGMRQRVAIARALHLGASVLLMDEPFGELDELTREEMGVEVRRVWREERKTVLFVTHSVPEAVFLADRCVVMSDQPGEIEGVFDVELPRPRDESVYGTAAFQEQVARVRAALHEGYELR
ncbi:ABC transporter ATP-binding protein [Halorussus gelatinilyticus]|uniref:ABC transporter ATP-binding protein n=1 Tax=Halorussus gelatinilyticus TaxID=2937524 RepID=A0A8U0IFL4_9EURY|nr:ABC transporter ATP-binding protein [Halorussus gelatinilyticus]UPV99677.1 ABC transporter ATP-binding protein [Halorussus gelatinilyticus]